MSKEALSFIHFLIGSDTVHCGLGQGSFMHEMSITQSIVEICEQHAAGRRVLSVTLEIGRLAGVVPESVEFCFAACAVGTVLEGADLVIETIPGQGRCHGCGAEFACSSYYEPCPSCGGYQVELLKGEELRVKELDVEEC
jgi:hydrogenase nickel incorporation protein HypA/HybF